MGESSAVDPNELMKTAEFIVAEGELLCRTALVMRLGKSGVAGVSEADDEDELLDALQDAQSQDASRPLIVLLGSASWLAATQGLQMQRKLVFVLASADCDCHGSDKFHAVLPPKASTAVLQDILLEACRCYGRGDAPN